MDRFQILVMMLSSKLYAESLLPYKEKIEALEEDKMSRFYLIDFKSPLIGLLLGVVPAFVLSGLTFDRFYKGDIGLGIVKLALWIFIFLGLILAGFTNEAFVFVIWGIDIVVLFIWNILDFFLVWQGIKADNLRKIILFLNQDEN